MRHIWVDVIISDLEKRHSEKVRALVDTGAMLTVLPKVLADKLGLKPTFESRVVTGAGEIKLKGSDVRVKVKDKEGITPVLISEIIDKVLIGVVLLESLGFIVDPTTGALKETALLLYFTR